MPIFEPVSLLTVLGCPRAVGFANPALSPGLALVGTLPERGRGDANILKPS